MPRLLTRNHLASRLYPEMTWRKRRTDRVVYLTFDDGPTPDVTEQVLSCLDRHQAKATFFCLGRRAHQRPDLVAELVARGHSVGNHTYSHPDARHLPLNQFLEDVQRGDDALTEASGKAPRLFRFPYGGFTRAARRALCLRYEVVMWDAASRDWDGSWSPQLVFNDVVRQIRPGSIMVFHDSMQARDRVLFALPRLLDELEGWRFEAL